jgi:sulfur carrier protein
MQKSNLIEVSVNGEPRLVPQGQTISDLLKQLEIAGDRVAVEMNKTIVRKRDWPATPVREGSQIEIVEFVGGG